MIKSTSPKKRPYWHVDAKWLTGIILVVLLNITFISFLLVQITSPKNGINLLAGILASSFSFEGGGMDASGDIEVMREKIAESVDGKWRPIAGMEIFVQEEDIAGKTPREVRLWFFRQWAEPLYRDGAEGLKDLISDPEMEQGLDEGIGPLGFINAKTHGKLLVVFLVCGLTSLPFLLLLVYFSHVSDAWAARAVPCSWQPSPG